MYKRTENKVSKVDYRLLYKKRIVDFWNHLKAMIRLYGSLMSP